MAEKTLEELEFEETGVTRKERWKVMWASIIGYAMDGLDVLIRRSPWRPSCRSSG